METNRNPYLPFIQLAFAQRKKPPGEQYYEPFTMVEDTFLIPQMTPPPWFYHGDRTPCASIEAAMYVVYNVQQSPPPGFEVCNAGFSPGGIPIPTLDNYSDEERMAMWQAGAAAIGMRSTPEEPSGLSFNAEALAGAPRVALVKGDTVLAESKASTTRPQSTIPEPQEEPEELQYHLVEGTDGYYLKMPKKELPRRITNFIIRMREIHHHINQNNSGENIREIYLDVTLFDPDKTVQLVISYEQLGQVLDIVKRKVGDANVFSNSRVFSERLEVHLRSSLRYCTDIYVYKICGWVNLPNGQSLYVHDNAVAPINNVRFNCGFSFGHGPKERSNQEIVCEAFEILAMAQDRTKIIVPFLWAHLGLMASLFTKLGHPPRALLFINGTSGSLKTAMSKFLFNFTAIPDNDIPASFRDTSASMEISIAQYRDRVLLVDDYCPAANQASRRAIDQTLENLIRFYGDGNTKARATPSMDVVHVKKAGGICVITGEDTAGSLSSQLRCLFLPVDKGSYNGQVLQRFQDAPHLWTEYLELFVRHLFAIVPDLMDRISVTFPLLRREAEQHLKERRLADICATLMVVAQITLEVASKLSGVDLLTQFKAEFGAAILQVCMDSENRAKQQNPAKLFASTLTTMLHHKDVTLSATVEGFVNEPKEYLGVMKDGYWWLWPDETFRCVVRYYEVGGKTFPLSREALWRTLVQEGVLIPTVVTRNGRTSSEYGTKVPFGSRPRLLKINPQRLHELAESE